LFLENLAAHLFLTLAGLFLVLTFRKQVPMPLQASPPQSEHRHRLPAVHFVRNRAVLGGVHHEYWLEKAAA
jgi:hypothetical protein